ncbi:MAG: GNAT family N-acetyltransferase [Armatimonadota bacterium]
MKIIDLKKDKSFIRQYVDLRNNYVELLLTSAVNITETERWLKKSDIEVRVLAEEDLLLGSAILYIDRGGEVAFFAKEQGKGIGSLLLNAIEDAARMRNLKSVWAWVLAGNIPAKKAFEKNGYIMENMTEREYNNTVKQGINFRKVL